MYLKIYFCSYLASQQPLDIGVFYRSSSKETFENVKDVLQALVKKYSTYNGKIRFSIVSFGKSPTLHKSFAEKLNTAALLQVILNLPYTKDEGLVDALPMTKSLLFKECIDEDKCRDKTFLIITDKKPSQNTKDNLINLASSGLKVIYTILTKENLAPSDIGLAEKNIEVKIIRIDNRNYGNNVDDFVGSIRKGK